LNIANKKGANITTKAQHWARRRNWYKARLKGIITLNINDNILTAAEQQTLSVFLDHVTDLLYLWDMNNEESKGNYIGLDITD